MRLWQYLLLPRLDGWFKWTICPGTFLVISASRGELTGWTGLLVLWFVLDHLVYPARYHWNDICGYASDIRHFNAARRSRLPNAADATGRHRYTRISEAALAVRLCLAAVIAATFKEPVTVAVLAGVVFGVASLYEWLRSRRSSPSGLAVLGIWLLIGLGYGVRASLGAYSAGVRPTSRLGTALFLYLAAFGAMFCYFSWALDATSHEGATADVRDRYLRHKPHVAGLLLYVTRDDTGGRVLLRRGRISAPWNPALLVAAGAGAVTGLEIAGAGPGEVPMSALGATLAALVLISIVASLALAACTTSRGRIEAGVVGAVALGVVAAMADFRLAPLATAPWTLLAAGYTGMRASSYAAIRRSPREWLARLLPPACVTMELARSRASMP